jgi:hypothetical protein
MTDPQSLFTFSRARSELHEAAEDAAYRLADLLDDTQHKDHDCGESGCPVSSARESLERLREALAAQPAGVDAKASQPLSMARIAELLVQVGARADEEGGNWHLEFVRLIEQEHGVSS